MKKIATLLCLSMIKLSLLGQSIIVVAGPNQSTFGQAPSTDGNNNTSITGFHAGVFVEFERRNFSIEPGLIFASIGGGSTFEDAHGPGAYGTVKSTVQYLQLPVNFLYNIPVTAGRIFLGGGPYLAIGLSGTLTEDDTVGSFSGVNTVEHTSNTYKFSSSDNPDYGLNATAGIHLNNGLLFSLGYGYGLKYAFDNGDTNGGGKKNNVASISIGYAFSR